MDRPHAAPTKRDMLAALRAPRTRTLVMVIFAVQLALVAAAVGRR